MTSPISNLDTSSSIGSAPAVFLRVEEDRRDLAAEADAAKALVRHKGNVFAGCHRHGVGGGLAAGAGADHVADIGDQMALRFQGFDELDRARACRLPRARCGAGTRVLQHGQGVQRNVGAAPGVGRRRQVVGVGFARYLEHGDRDFLCDFRAGGEPFGIGPALDHFFRMLIARFGFLRHIVEEVEHQQGFLQCIGCDRSHIGIIQQVDQRLDVVAAHHGAQQFGCLRLTHQFDLQVAVGDGSQERGLNLGGIIYTGRYAVGQQIHQESFFAGGWIFDQLDDFGGLLRSKWQGRDAQRGAFGYVLTISY